MVFLFLFGLIWSCFCLRLVWLFVYSPHLSVPHYPVHLSPILFSLCLSGLYCLARVSDVSLWITPLFWNTIKTIRLILVSVVSPTLSVTEDPTLKQLPPCVPSIFPSVFLVPSHPPGFPPPPAAGGEISWGPHQTFPGPRQPLQLPRRRGLCILGF